MNLGILEKISDGVGYLMLNEFGAIIASGGDLENDEKTADTIFGLVSMTDQIDKTAFSGEGFNKLSVNFKDCSYVICLSNKRIHIVKRKFSPSMPQQPDSPPETYLVDTQIPITNSINS